MPPVDAGLSVVIDVIKTIDGVGGEGAAADEGGPKELVPAATVSGGAVAEGGRARELDAAGKVPGPAEVAISNWPLSKMNRLPKENTYQLNLTPW